MVKKLKLIIRGAGLPPTFFLQPANRGALLISTTGPTRPYECDGGGETCLEFIDEPIPDAIQFIIE